MDKLDEAALRRQDFVGGTPVTLADGRDWFFARPVVVFRVADTECGFETRLDLDGDDGTFTRLTAERDAAREAGDDVRFVAAELRIGSLLLKRNYDLTTAQVAELMPFSFGEDNAATKIHEAVIDVARGLGPKP